MLSDAIKSETIFGEMLFGDCSLVQFNSSPISFLSPLSLSVILAPDTAW